MQNINNSLKEELIKLERIESFLNSTYPDVSISTRNLYKTKIRKYMSGNSKSDQKRFELLLRQDIKAVKAYRKLFNQFLIFCKDREKEIIVTSKTNLLEGEVVMVSKNNRLPVNDQIMKIPGYQKLVKVFVKDIEHGMNKKEIVKVFYPIVHNKRTFLSYFYTYLKELNLWDGKDIFFINLANKENNAVNDVESRSENTNLVECKNDKLSMDLDDIIESIKSLGLDADHSESILDILNAEKQKRTLEAQQKIINEETDKYFLSLKERGISEMMVDSIHHLLVASNIISG